MEKPVATIDKNGNPEPVSKLGKLKAFAMNKKAQIIAKANGEEIVPTPAPIQNTVAVVEKPQNKKEQKAREKKELAEKEREMIEI